MDGGPSTLQRFGLRVCAAVCSTILLGWIFSAIVWAYGLSQWDLSLLWDLQWSGQSHSITISAGNIRIFGKGNIQRDIGFGFSRVGHKPYFSVVPQIEGMFRKPADRSLEWSWLVEIPPFFLFVISAIPLAFARVARKEASHQVRTKRRCSVVYLNVSIVVAIWTLTIVLIRIPFMLDLPQLSFVVLSIWLGWYCAGVRRYGASVIGVLCLALLPVVIIRYIDFDQMCRLVLGRFGDLESFWALLFLGFLISTIVHIGSRANEISKARQFHASTLCTSCLYDLTGNVSGICPECGTPIDRRVCRHVIAIRTEARADG